MSDNDSSAAMAGYGQQLVEAVDGAIETWVVEAVRRFLGRRDPAALAAAIAEGEIARAEIVPRLRALLEADIDAQATTPLSILRDAVRFPTAVLARAGVAPVERDADAASRFPDDVYDLTPASFADFGVEVGEAGIAWGAAKAFAHRERHCG